MAAMERIYNCIACHKAFKVTGIKERSDEPEKPDVPLNVVCPFCETANVITWPQGSKYIVGLPG